MAAVSRDHVSARLHDAVFRRDGCCVKALYSPTHICRDRFGVKHAPTFLDLLTIEHVHDGYGMTGRRAPSDLRHCLALCWAANVTEPPSHDFRVFERAYLAEKNTERTVA